MGLEISIGWLTILMFGSLAVLLMAGLPLAFVTGGLACIFLFVFGDAAMLNILPSRIFPMMTDYQLSAIPLFIFMATMLARAGVIEELFDVVYKVLGGLKGGLATATIIASTILAAMAGVIGATEVTMGILALPAMLKRHYHPTIACGSILAGGTLGILIPPSILAILFAVVAQQSVGELFIGAVVPGLLLSGLYILYVTGRSYLNPALGPALPLEERVSLREKFQLLRGIIAPIILIILVLGVIFTGIATPVEAAGIGTYGALVVAALHRRADVDRDPRSHLDHPQGHGHGSVDHFRCVRIRWLLRAQWRPGIRLKRADCNRIRVVRDSTDHDDHADCVGDVSRLGRYTVACGPNLCSFGGYSIF